MSAYLQQANFLIIIIVFSVSLLVLSKSADLLVNNAVKLSKVMGLSEVVIGATIVSLGTTLPELSAAVVSALQGNGSFGLGNAIGSVITNTSLILGLSALFGVIPVTKMTSQKLSILNSVVVLLILPMIIQRIRGSESPLSQWIGLVFLLLVPVYFIHLLKREKKTLDPQEEISTEEKPSGNTLVMIVLIFISAVFVSLSASTLVSSAEVVASRVGIPDVVIASTIVAFGTSVPELTTALTSAKNGYGGLAIGNVMGANILNIILVSGASITLSVGGLIVPDSFYVVHIPAMVIILAIFSFVAYNTQKNEISKKEGVLLISVYFIYIVGNLISAFM
jgi:cation:H+ antiporter